MIAASEERTRFLEEIREGNRRLLTWSIGVFNVFCLSWSASDHLLAPEHWRFFLLLRITLVVITYGIVFAVHRPAFRRRTLEAWWLCAVAYGVLIAPTLPMAGEGLNAYVMGYVLIILSIGFLPVWSPAWVASALGVMWTAVAASHFLWSPKAGSVNAASEWVVLLSAAGVSIVSAAFKYSQKKYWFQQKELVATELKLRLANAEMQALRAQIQPHFLFNTLHLISSLLRSDPDAAERVISRLGDLLRMATDEAAQEVPLHEEIEFAKRYVEIQQIRFSDALSVTWRVDPLVLDVIVPNFVLQPLIENSVKHILRATGNVHIRIEAWQDEQVLKLRVADDGPATPKPARTRSGVGLVNLNARLSRLFGERASVSLDQMEGRGSVATVSVPIRGRATAEDEEAVG